MWSINNISNWYGINLLYHLLPNMKGNSKLSDRNLREIYPLLLFIEIKAKIHRNIWTIRTRIFTKFGAQTLLSFWVILNFALEVTVCEIISYPGRLIDRSR